MSLFSRESWRFEIIHRDYSEESLKLATIWVFAAWFLKTLHESMPTIAMLPLEAYDPLGMIRVLPNSLWPVLLSPAFLETLRALLLASMIGVFVVMVRDVREIRREEAAGTTSPERAARATTLLLPIVACVLMTLYQGIFRGYAGHISHEDTLLLYASYMLAVFPVATWIAKRSGSVDPRVNLNALPVVMILFTLLMIYTVVAVYRLLYGAPEIFTSGSMTYWALRNTVEVLDPGPGLGFLLADHRWVELIFLIGFPIITVMEFVAPLALVLRPFRVFFITVFLAFHFTTYLFMDVIFRETLALYALFLDPVKVLEFFKLRSRVAQTA